MSGVFRRPFRAQRRKPFILSRSLVVEEVALSLARGMSVALAGNVSGEATETLARHAGLTSTGGAASAVVLVMARLLAASVEGQADGQGAWGWRWIWQKPGQPVRRRY